MEDQLNQITGLTAELRKKALSWAASLPEVKIIEIIQDGVKKSFQIKNDLPEITGKICKYCALIVAIRAAGWDTLKGKGYRIAEQPQYDDFSSLRKSKASELIHKGRTPIVRQKILAYWGEVKELKASGLGFRPIAKYLGQTRKVKTSSTYLAQLWREVELG